MIDYLTGEYMHGHSDYFRYNDYNTVLAHFGVRCVIYWYISEINEYRLFLNIYDKNGYYPATVKFTNLLYHDILDLVTIIYDFSMFCFLRRDMLDGINWEFLVDKC